MIQDVATESDQGRRLLPRWGLNRRTVQIVLGVAWIIDGALQLQPRMFTQDFVNQVLLASASGQPGWLASAITHMANFVSHDVAMWNTLFALVQLAIGIGLLRRRSARTALAASFAWVLFVWVLGEGMGQIFTGSATPLMGAPGAVLLYGAIGVLVWPSSPRPSEETAVGVASSAGGHGPLGGRGALAIWTTLWAVYAVLFLLPDNRASNSVHDMIAGMANGQPGWYAHFLNSTAHAFVGAGSWTAVLLAFLCLVVAIGPLVSRDPVPFLVGGAGLALLFWVTGQALGGILTGIGTDPNTGPLLVLLAATLLPTVPAPASALTPAGRVFAGRPGWAATALAGLIAVPVAVAAVPLTSTAAPAASANGAAVKTAQATPSSGAGSAGLGMAGMPGMSGMTGTQSSSGASSSPSGSGSGASGSAGKGEMNMAGMAGSGVTAPGWHYTGPALPGGEVTLLSAAGAIQDTGHAMQTPNCTAAPTANQVLGATQYVQAVTSAVAKYKVLSAATAAGYIPVTPTSYPIVHYVNVAYMNPRYILDPNHVDSLVYAVTPNGPVLVAAMFLLAAPGTNGPMPYGCMLQWHAHTNLCYSDTTRLVMGFTPCPAGQYNVPSAYMTHVWQVQVSGGPLAVDPSDLEVMEAAVQAQQSGLAPITSTAGAVSYNDVTAPVGAF